MKLSYLKEIILDILFPQFCLICKKEGDIVCKDCLSLIEVSEQQFCPFCETPKIVIGKGKCPLHEKMNLDGLFSATDYKNILIKKLITSFKYNPFLKDLSPHLASLIIAHFLLSENKIIFKQKENTIIVPVPLSAARFRWRGFNQATLLAKELSEFLKASLQVNNLIKIKEAQPQVSLSKERRRENVQNAFFLRNPQIVKGKRIFLIDDVFTTGATMEECAKVLKIGGAKEVWGVVIARG